MDRKTEDALDEAAGLAQLLEHCERRLDSYDRLAIFRFDAGGEPVLRKLRGSSAQEMEGHDKQAMEALMRSVKEEGKARLVLDSSKDRDLKDLPRLFGSALCAPITDGSGAIVGLVYADSQQCGAFHQSHLNELTELGGAVGRRMAEKPKERPQPASAGDLRPLLGSVLLVLAAGLWMLVGSYRQASAPPSPTATPRGVTMAAPASVAQSYLRGIQNGRLEEAHALLAGTVKKRVPSEKFVAHLKTWSAEGGNLWQLQNRKARAGETGDRKATVYLSPPSGFDDTWEWGLVNEQGGWKLQSFRGGPGPP